MKSLFCPLFFLIVLTQLGCTGDIRQLDLEDKQFEATINVDSTLGLDSALLNDLAQRKVVYSFGKDGAGQLHSQMGMLSQDNPFHWELHKDSLLLDKKLYAIKKTEGGFRLKSDSTLVFLRPQPSQ